MAHDTHLDRRRRPAQDTAMHEPRRDIPTTDPATPQAPIGSRVRQSEKSPDRHQPNRNHGPGVGYPDNPGMMPKY